VRDEDYEFSSFLSSRMRFRVVRCEDCHNPHSAKTILPGNWLCMRCHDGSYTNAPVIKPVAHSHHKVFGYDTNGVLQTIDLMGYNPREIKETGGECVNCHMPKTVYMQRHWRHDHGFTSPDPSLTQQFGIPNACNRCHQDKSTQWALDAYEKWYGAPTNSTRRTRSWLFTRAKRGDADSRDGVLKILETDEIPYWRAAAANLLSPWTSERIVADALLRSLEDTNTLVREAAVRSLAPVLESTGSRSEIEADLKRCLNDPSRNVRIAAALALRTGIAPGSQAGQDLNQFLAFNADQPIGQLQAGLTAQAIGDSQRALGHFQKAVEWDSHSVPLRQQLAVTLSELGRASEAVATLTAAVSLEPDNADLHFQLALAHNETGDIHATAGQLAKAVALNPRHSRAWYNLGLAQNELGNFSVAVESLLQAENLDPSNPTIPYARATILARLDRTTEARAAARRALEIQPSYADARRLLDLLSR
jgi:tetratricopeptide (TPR) repeat protein